MNYLLNISYNGLKYLGFQFQKEHKNTIQQILQEKIQILLKHEVFLTVAGRTDKGVHANEQVVNFKSEIIIDLNIFVFKLNALLKLESIIVNYCQLVSDSFNSRYDCLKKEYKYYLSNKKNLFFVTYWQIKRVDINYFQNCANLLIGNHDFKSFQDSDCQAKSSIRTIEKFNFYEENNFIIASIIARSFLHHQIRIMIGTIIQLFLTNKNYNLITTILLEKNRTKAGLTAPANGLFLNKLYY